jgi:hypothetical protein
MSIVYVYGSKLEIASPRFSQRADFFTYICFVCFIILVSHTSVIIFLLLSMGGSANFLDSDFTLVSCG